MEARLRAPARLRLPARALAISTVLLSTGCFAKEAPRPGPVLWVWSGAVTDTSVQVRAKITRPFTRARLKAGLTPALDSAVHSRNILTLPLRKDEVYLFPLAGLKPDTRYYYQVEVDGRADTAASGRFRTLPSGPASFRFAFSSCARTGSAHPVFGRILSTDPLFFLHVGDLHYENVASADPDDYRRAYDKVLASPVQRNFFRALPVVYVWDDHDFGGNNSDSTNVGRRAARKIYREYVPHYPLPDKGTIQQAFTVGRVRFLITDGRSSRSPRRAADDGGKTMLGKDQKAWFKSEIRAARGAYPLVVWVNTMPWIGSGGKDDWSRYAAERRELSDFIKEQGIRLCMLSGDAHMLAIDDGSNSGYAGGGGAGFPVFHAAPLDRPGKSKGGPYSHGTSRKRGQFGVMKVEDSGGERIRVEWLGMNHRGETVMRHDFEVPAVPGRARGP